MGGSFYQGSFEIDGSEKTFSCVRGDNTTHYNSANYTNDEGTYQILGDWSCYRENQNLNSESFTDNDIENLGNNISPYDDDGTLLNTLPWGPVTRINDQCLPTFGQNGIGLTETSDDAKYHEDINDLNKITRNSILACDIGGFLEWHGEGIGNPGVATVTANFGFLSEDRYPL